MYLKVLILNPTFVIELLVSKNKINKVTINAPSEYNKNYLECPKQDNESTRETYSII